MKRHNNESVDSYYNRFHSLLDDLEDAGEAIPTKTAIRQFIFTLGSDFIQIQNNFRIGLLPDDWKMQDWPSLLVLCRDYANSIRPQGLSKIDPNSDFALDASIDRTQHHKKIKQWFMNPGKFKNEIAAEQAKYTGKCIYHLTKSHPTCECYIKKECDKMIAARKNTTSNATPGAGISGQLRHLTDNNVEDEPVEDVADSLPDLSSNNTNEDALYYIARVSNHY
jgi:hypothetical protein